MRVQFSPQFARDLRSIGSYIARDNPTRAESFVRELKAQAIKVSQEPEIYRLRPELGKGIRLAAHYSYVIVFRIDKDMRGRCVFIERIFHGSRDISAMLPS